MYDTLKMTKNLAPTQLKVNGEIVNDPKKMANEFNNFFINKIKKLRDQTNALPLINPIDRLFNWLQQRNITIPEFELKLITLDQLKMIIKKI